MTTIVHYVRCPACEGIYHGCEWCYRGVTTKEKARDFIRGALARNLRRMSGECPDCHCPSSGRCGECERELGEGE